ncbi:hypothetical protein FRC02_002842 [Tulasnella sp. 418]|nr:hypothetical protein FRC02_002842 [Tulasnella sp. 418]
MARKTPRGIARRGIKASAKPSAAPSEPHKEVKVGGAKNGSTRLVPTTKAPRYYPAEDTPAPKPRKTGKTVQALRPTLSPGTVVILLAGRFRGKRAVFLKQLDSGLLLITGPYKINGVPLRRVSQAYVIATSTKVDLSGVNVDAKVNDAYFGKDKSKEKRSAEEEFFSEGKPKAKEAYPEAKASDQKSVDAAVLGAVKKTEHLAKYLKASWGLSKGQYPHQITF